MTSSQAPMEEHVFLAGRPPIAEFIAVVESATKGGSIDRRELADEWRRANDRVRELERTESGIADRPPLGPVSAEVEELRRAALEDPMFRQAFSLVPFDIVVVELDRLVGFQKHINLTVVEDLKAGLGPSPTSEDIFRFCIPAQQTPPAVEAMQIAQTAYAFVSPSRD